MEQSPNVHKIRAICGVTRNLDGPKGSCSVAACHRQSQPRELARCYSHCMQQSQDSAPPKRNVRQISALPNVVAN
jgi:hypothetical protein